MSILVGDNFSYSASKPLDARLKYSTTAEMKAVVDATMYDGCTAYCSESDKTYQWKSTNTVDETLGRWREFSSGGGDDENAYHTTDAAETTLSDSDKFPFYDASASAKRNSTWSNIKSKLKTYFDTLYNKVTAGTGLSLSSNTMSIKPFESGDMDEVMATLPSVQARYPKYSTEEQIVGEWVDGKPLYQKTITGQLFPLSSWNTAIEKNYACNYTHNISNIDYIINIFGFAYWSGDNTRYVIMGNNCDTRMDCTKTILKLLVPKTGIISPYTDYASAIYNITIQYTKTTD